MSADAFTTAHESVAKDEQCLRIKFFSVFVFFFTISQLVRNKIKLSDVQQLEYITIYL